LYIREMMVFGYSFFRGSNQQQM